MIQIYTDNINTKSSEEEFEIDTFEDGVLSPESSPTPMDNAEE